MSILTMGFRLGIAMGPLVAGVLAVLLFELPILVVGAATVVAAVIVQRCVPETVEPGKRG